MNLFTFNFKSRKQNMMESLNLLKTILESLWIDELGTRVCFGNSSLQDPSS
jgi:hypothetical protein